MADNGQDLVQHLIDPHLDENEVILAVAKARVPVRRSGGHTFTGVHVVRWGYRLATIQRKRASAAERISRAGFPAHPQMLLALTPERLFVLPTDRHYRPSGPPRWLSRDALVDISLPFVGNGRWKGLAIEARSGGRLLLAVDRDEGTGLATAFARGCD